MNEEKRITATERVVLWYVAKGLRNKEIATEMGISLYTVKNHVHSILWKLGCTNRGAAARKVYGNSVDVEPKGWRDQKRALEAALDYSFWCDGRMVKAEWTLQAIMNLCGELWDYLHQSRDEQERQDSKRSCHERETE